MPAIRLRRDKPRYGKCKLSSGGSGVTGLVGIEELKQEFPGVPVYGELVLDEGDRRRQENIPELLKHYSELADGICLYDNRRHPWLTDQAQALWGPAAVTAPWFDPRAPEDFNAWGDVHDTHKFSTIRACFKRVKVEHRQAWRDQLPPLHYTLTSQLEFAILQAIQDVLTNATSQSLPLQEAEPRFIYVILPVRPEPDLLKIAQGVQQAVKPQLGFNTKLAFASIGKPLAMHTQEVGIAVVSFFPLAADLKAIEDYLTERQPVDPRFLTPPSIAQGGNGYAGPVTATPPVETGAAERAHA